MLPEHSRIQWGGHYYGPEAAPMSSCGSWGQCSSAWGCCVACGWGLAPVSPYAICTYVYKVHPYIYYFPLNRSRRDRHLPMGPKDAPCISNRILASLFDYSGVVGHCDIKKNSCQWCTALVCISMCHRENNL